jgi:hypothetical protein
MLRKRLFELGLFVALVAGLLFSVNFAAQAQEPGGGDGGEVDPVTVQFTGTVEPDSSTGEVSIGQGGITVGGVKVAPASGFWPAGFANGDCVTVTGFYLESDVLQVFDTQPGDCSVDEVVDTDGDGVPDDQDNCPEKANTDQLNTDGDEFGDACDPDIDNDGVLNDDDICPTVSNPDQNPEDANDNQVPDECENTGDENQNEDQNQEQEGCTNGQHPVLEAYVAEFGEELDVTYDDLETWFCEDHMGMGEIGRALLMGEAMKKGDATCGDYTSYSEILDARAEGENWGALKKECGINGGNLAPGRVISAQHGHKNNESTTSEGESVGPGNSGTHGNSGNNPGHGGTPPGQEGKDKGKDNNPGQGHGKSGE